MRTAVFGGSFDPIHLGHLHLIHQLATLTDYQRLIIIPVANPPHKQKETSISDAHRLTMLDLALKEYVNLYPNHTPIEMIIDSCEIDRGGVSYMFDTVTELYNRYPIEGELGMVLGDDLLDGLRRWYRFDELRHKVEFIVIRRKLVPPPQHFPPGARGRFLDNPIMEDSSTAVRQLMQSHKATMKTLSPLVPYSVANYLLEHALYQL
ncbi:MAG: nicotinate (nicotinamide) nucleotide adenylyltransferase [Sphaerochaetaceae bacterium]|jgi:nicotinate-nucleotide adenylyltransferase